MSPPGGETAHQDSREVESPQSDWRCTICGAFESDGGCEHDREGLYAEITFCAECKHPDEDCICEYDSSHDHACCAPEDCCGGPCAAHPCWDLTT